MGRYLAIDLGAESGRVILGDLTAGRLALEELHRFPNTVHREADGLHWDLEALWEEIRFGLGKGADLGVQSISVDSWALDYVRLDANGLPLGNPFCYRDGRTRATYQRARKALGDAAIYAQTGVQFMPINSLYHLLADRDAGGLEGVDRFLMIGDWFHAQLCGRMVQEESNASTTQLWNPVERAWSDALISESGLPRAIFPDVVAPCSRLGTLLPSLQKETGLGPVEVVAGCVHDTGAAVAGVPASGDDWAYISSGTWSLVGVELDGPLITETAQRANFTNETGVDGTSRFLRNASGLWLLQECRNTWAKTGRSYTYAELTALAEEAEPFVALVNPDDPSFLRPDDMPAAIAAYCHKTGQKVPESDGAIVRCICESLGLLYRNVLQQAESVTGKAIRRIHIVGGGSRNTLLNQMTTDATGCEVIAGPTEATAIGNLLLQALTLGELRSLEEVRQVIRRSFPTVQYQPSNEEAWVHARRRFAELVG